MIPTLFGISIVRVPRSCIWCPGGPVEQAISRTRLGGAVAPVRRAVARARSGGLTRGGVRKSFEGLLRLRQTVACALSAAGSSQDHAACDLGKSYNYKEPVCGSDLRAGYPISLQLRWYRVPAWHTLFVSRSGVYKAMHHRTWKDTPELDCSSSSATRYPEFALGMLLLVLLGGGSSPPFFDICCPSVA